MNSWIDYRELRSKLRFIDVLKLYGVEVRARGEQYTGPCPLPGHEAKGTGSPFSANLTRGIFRCFGCNAQGNVLDFAVLMEKGNPRDGKDFRKVAEKLVRAEKGSSPEQSRVKPSPPTPQPKAATTELINAPLDFELKGLDQSHPWFTNHGTQPDTVAKFGLGFATRGYFAGRIAIPLHDLNGHLVGYTGRILDDTKIGPENPKYLFAKSRERNGFTHRLDLSQLLFNAHRSHHPTETLRIAFEPEMVFQAVQFGMDNVVALWGGECSDEVLSAILDRSESGGILFLSPKLPSEFLWSRLSRLRKIGSEAVCKSLDQSRHRWFDGVGPS